MLQKFFIPHLWTSSSSFISLLLASILDLLLLLLLSQSAENSRWPERMNFLAAAASVISYGMGVLPSQLQKLH